MLVERFEKRGATFAIYVTHFSVTSCKSALLNNITLLYSYPDRQVSFFFTLCSMQFNKHYA